MENWVEFYHDLVYHIHYKIFHLFFDMSLFTYCSLWF